LKGLGKGPKRFDVSLDAHVSEDEECRRFIICKDKRARLHDGGWRDGSLEDTRSSEVSGTVNYWRKGTRRLRAMLHGVPKA